MKSEVCKVPMEDYTALNGRTNSSHKFILIAGFLLFVTTGILIGFTYQSFSQIDELREEIDSLKNTLKELRSTVTEYDDFYTEDSGLEKRTESISKPESESEPEDGYEYEEDYSGDYPESDEEDNEIIVNGGTFTKDLKDTKRLKRSIVGYTEDGVPINSEPFAEARRKNLTLRRNPSAYQGSQPFTLTPGIRLYQESNFHQPMSTPSPIYSRKSRVLHRDDPSKAFRQVVKKSSLKSMDQTSQEDSQVEFVVVKNQDRIRHRSKHVETFDEKHPVRIGRMRPLPAAHFSGDTSKYVLGRHENFRGNGHLRHPQKTYVDWSESSWFRTLGMDRHFTLSDGILTIKEAGLYFVYAQIFFVDEHDTNGFRVYKNQEIILQCTTTSNSETKRLKSNTCFTAGADYLEEDDTISLGDFSDSGYSLFEPGKSFFGIIKIGDVKIK